MRYLWFGLSWILSLIFGLFMLSMVLTGNWLQAALVQDMPDIRVEVLNTGHLIGAEQPEQVNALITEFFEAGE